MPEVITNYLCCTNSVLEWSSVFVGLCLMVAAELIMIMNPTEEKESDQVKCILPCLHIECNVVWTWSHWRISRWTLLMTKPAMEDWQTHANIIGAVSQDNKISLAGKWGREAKHIGLATAASTQPTSHLRDRKIRNISRVMLAFNLWKSVVNYL